MTASIYYLEINVFCIMLQVLVIYKIMSSQDKQRSQQLFAITLIVSCLYMICDCLWCLAANGYIDCDINGNYMINSFYFIFASFPSLGWFYFCEASQNTSVTRSKTLQILACIPFLILVILVISSRWTGILFYIDADNVYHRGPLHMLHFLMSYGYVIYSTSFSLIRAFRPENYAVKDKYISIASFAFFPFIFGVAQIFVSGMPVLCMGTTLAVVQVYISMLNNQISVDPLTGINNRGALIKYLYRKMDENTNQHLSILMIDIDFFKNVNDRYGHVEGDAALTRVAKALMNSCHRRPCFISRYGGDEFIIVYDSCNESDINLFIDDIHTEIENVNSTFQTPYVLSLSIGFAIFDSKMHSVPDFIKKADKHLYSVKHNRKTHPSEWQ